MAKIIKIPSAYVIDTKVVGVSHTNEDGTPRQTIITREVEENDLLTLEPEPNNPYDPNAVKVLSKNGNQIGYLKKEVAEQIYGALHNDITIHVKASWVSEREIKGVGLRIELVN
ncbi:MAG: HIRAN domain-containing protein [Bacteroidota bacterium]